MRYTEICWVILLLPNKPIEYFNKKPLVQKKPDMAQMSYSTVMLDMDVILKTVTHPSPVSLFCGLYSDLNSVLFMRVISESPALPSDQ